MFDINKLPNGEYPDSGSWGNEFHEKYQNYVKIELRLGKTQQ